MVSLKTEKGKKTPKTQKEKKHLIQNQEERLWASQAVGLSTLRTHSRICSENSETPRPTDCVLGMGEGPGHLCAQTKGQRCRQLHLCPPPRLRASCAPIEVPGVALTHAGAQKHLLLPQLRPGSLKANLGKSHKFPFSRTEFLPAHW